MNSWNRLGTGLLGAAGMLVVSLMTYTLFFTRGPSTSGTSQAVGEAKVAAARVAIFLPDRRDWADFRLAVLAGERKGFLRLIADQPGSLVTASTRTGRRIQFERHDVRGVSDTREEVQRLARVEPPPVALVGSTTSVLTVALAEPLREEGKTGPILAIPWATAVMVQHSTRGGGEARHDLVPLMELDPGRTFRFCPNNRRLAESVVDCLITQDEGRLPGRVFSVVDPFDPYSDDLAACFRQVIRDRKPDVEIVERADVVDLPSFARSADSSAEPSTTESSLADAIVSSREAADDRPTWVVLPLQDQPARRMITALRRRSAWPASSSDRTKGQGPLRVVCGDAIERLALNEMAGVGGLSIWCASTSSTTSKDQGVSDDTQTLAEIIAALVWAVDQATTSAPTPEETRVALQSIHLAIEDPLAFGRQLAFEPTGERRGNFERVLMIRPDGSPPVEWKRSQRLGWEPFNPPSPPLTP